MREAKDVLRAATRLREGGAVATVVEIEGSSYRPEGARMLVRPDGSHVGTISGGCLEGEVVQQAGRVLDAGRPDVLTFEQADGEDPFGFGSGCGGTVHVLLEPIRSEGDGGLPQAGGLRLLQHCFDQRQGGALATVYRATGALADHQGRHLLVLDGESARDDIEHRSLRDALTADAAEVLRDDRAARHTYTLAEGRADVLIEAIRPPLRLLVFGAEDDAVPLVRLAGFLGWEAVVVGAAPVPALEARFPGAAQCVTLPHPEELPQKLTIGPRDAAVAMSHNYIFDRDVLRHLLASPAGYVGALGARRRLKRLAGDFADGGTPGDRAAHEAIERGRLSGPVGLDIGADTPQEIALSITAEVQAVFAGCGGGRLSRRAGRIHPPEARPSSAQGDGAASHAPRETVAVG